MPVKLNVPLPSGGLIVDRPGEFVDTRSATNSKNVDVNRNIIRKRPGTVALGATLAEQIMRYFELQVGSTSRLFRVGITDIQDLTKATSTWNSVTASALTATVDDHVSYAFPLLAGAKTAVYTNGVDAIRKVGITGDDADLGGTPPLARFVRAFGPYLVLGYITDGGTTYYSRVQWCDTGDPETWTGGNAGSVDLLEDSADITGLGLFGNFLTVHKRESIYIGQLVTTSDVFRFDRKPTGVGTVAEATIANLPSGEQAFLALDGIHLFNGTTAPLISAPIQDELRETINPAAIHRSCGGYVEGLDEYWCAVPIGGSLTPNTIYKYNTITGKVYKDERPDMTTFSFYVNTTEDTWDSAVGIWDTETERWDSAAAQSLTKLIVFGDSAGLSTVKNLGAYADNGVAFASNFETKDFTAADFGVPDFDKIMRWKGIEIWGTGTGVALDYSIDGGTTWVTVGTGTLTSNIGADYSPAEFYFDVVASRIRFRFSNDESNGTFSMTKYQIEATPREYRR